MDEQNIVPFGFVSVSFRFTIYRKLVLNGFAIQIINGMETKHLCLVFSNFKKENEKEASNYFSIPYNYSCSVHVKVQVCPCMFKFNVHVFAKELYLFYVYP